MDDDIDPIFNEEDDHLDDDLGPIFDEEDDHLDDDIGPIFDEEEKSEAASVPLAVLKVAEDVVDSGPEADHEKDLTTAYVSSFGARLIQSTNLRVILQFWAYHLWSFLSDPGACSRGGSIVWPRQTSSPRSDETKQPKPDTFLMSPRPGCQIIEGILYRDQNWREEFFVFKIDKAYVGSFDFSKLPR
ncbi:hypothetical protein F2Q69_00058654 [Brassica cretica]|uniref:Uncharacterized protein n=1 Tax=Brassica cretica TaxID=69181 RepID=A0A8S9RJ38_BRACR|nr:hypothetical protein F2Q69_00058654 [Brassica cretica]